MRVFLTASAAILLASLAGAQVPNPEPESCGAPLTAVDQCSEAEGGGEEFDSLNPAEIDAIVRAAASATNRTDLTIAVVDRAGRPLALFRQPNADPENDDKAVGVARTTAFFSHNQAPLSSRTVRFISAIHFPTGVTNTNSAALYGIDNTNRGCDFNVVFNEGKCTPRARSLNGRPCNAFDTSGCGQGIVTGKIFPGDEIQQSVNAGGIPLFRILNLTEADQGRVSEGKMIGGIGVVGISEDPEEEDPQITEYAAATGAFGALNAGVGAIVPVPQFPLPKPGNVFIDGIRLPFLGRDITLRFNEDGLPIGVLLAGIQAGTDAGEYAIEPRNGGCAANGYLVGPLAGSNLTAAEVDAIVRRSDSAAKRTRAAIRLPPNRYARMAIAVADVDGTLLAVYRMPDATIFSTDVSVAKARNVVYFTNSTDLPGVPAGTAVTNRSIAFGSHPFFPPGIDGRNFKPRPGPFFESIFVRDLNNPCSQGLQPANANQTGIVFFAGSTPLFRGNEMIGGLGVSGDGIEQDDYVTFLGAGEFLPPRERWADRIIIDKVRLPQYKFPRQPEGVTECGGGPCD